MISLYSTHLCIVKTEKFLAPRVGLCHTVSAPRGDLFPFLKRVQDWCILVSAPRWFPTPKMCAIPYFGTAI